MTREQFQKQEFTIEPLSEATLVESNEMRLQSWLDTYVNEHEGVSREWIEERNNRQRSPEAMQKRRERLTASNASGWIAKDSAGNVIGLTWPFVDEMGEQHVGSLYVDKAWHGKGVGGALMQKVIEWFDPAKPIVLGVVTYNERAKAFYRKWGFEEVSGSEDIFDGKIPEMKMIRKVSKVKITYFVHGTTTDNEAKKATGWLPGELSQQGVQQAKNLPNQVEDTTFSTVFCSDLGRAIDSARLGFGDTHEIIIDKRLREANYGDMNGKAHSFKDSMVDYIDMPFPGGESYRDVERRMSDFIDMLRKDYAGKHVAIVAHEAPQLALEVVLNDKTWQQAIDENWRKTGDWKPGWVYGIK